MVGVTGFEPAASTSQTSRATNCATPRKVKNIEFLMVFRKWSNLWSKHFVGVFLKRQIAEKVSVFKGFQRFRKLTAGNCLHAPKARALPIAPHLVIDFSYLYIIPRNYGFVYMFLLIYLIFSWMDAILIDKLFFVCYNYMKFCFWRSL